MADFVQWPGQPVEVTVVDKPPTVPDFGNANVPKVTGKERPGVVPAVVPVGVMTVLNTSEHFARLPVVSTAQFAFSSKPAAVAQSPA